MQPAVMFLRLLERVPVALKDTGLMNRTICLILAVSLVLEAYLVKATNGRWAFEPTIPAPASLYRVGYYKDKIYMMYDTIGMEVSNPNSRLDSIWISDIETLDWTSQVTSGTMPDNRVGGSMTFDVNNGLMYFFGGMTSDGFLNDLYVLSMDDFVWKSITPNGIRPGKRFASYSFLYMGFFYILGGNSPNDLADVWKYSPETNTWEVVADYEGMLQSQFGVDGVFDNEKYYLFGGCGVLESSCPARLIVFDAKKSKWEAPVEFPFQSQNFASIKVYNNTLYALGGFFNGNFLFSYFPVTKIDIITKALISQELFIIQPSSIYPVRYPSGRMGVSSLLIGDQFYCFGGTNMAGHNHIWIYNPESDDWVGSNLDRYPLPRLNPLTVVVSPNEFGVFGGLYLDAYVVPINDLWTYNIGTKLWRRLSQENICPTSDYTCVPSVYGGALGYYDGSFFVIGGFTLSADVSPVSRKFITAANMWVPVVFNDPRAFMVSMRYMVAFKVIGSYLYIWGGQDPMGNIASSEVIVLDMEKEDMFFFPQKTSSVQEASNSIGLNIDENFCVVGNVTDLNRVGNSMWCFNQTSMNWNLFGSLPPGMATKDTFIEYYVNLVAFGGNDARNRPLNQFLMFDARENVLGNLGNYIKPMNLYAGSSVVLNGIMYLFSGMSTTLYSFTSSNALFSFNMAETWCSGKKIVSAFDSKIDDGSGKFKYFPGTDCIWDIYNATYIKVESIDIGMGASLIIENMDDCGQPIISNGIEFNTLSIRNAHQGGVVYTPSQRIRLRFHVEMKVDTYDGFSLLLYDCKLGFDLDSNECVCPAGRYINSLGDCIQCPPGTTQPLENQTECKMTESLGVTSTFKIPEVYPGELIELTSYPPPMMQSSMAVLDSMVYVVGGYSTIDGEGNSDYSSMKIVYKSSQLYNSKWTRAQATGEIPSGRADFCFVGLEDQIMLIGGRSQQPDPYLYHLEVNTTRWKKTVANPDVRIGSICGEYKKMIYIYGGTKIDGTISNDMQVYSPETYSLFIHVTNGAAPRLSHAGGGVWMSSLYIFGGWNGESEQGTIYTLNLDNMRWMKNVTVALDSCIECDQDKGVCDFSRQKMVSGVIDGRMHVYGGSFNGQALADILVIDIDSGVITKRENYGIFSPMFPLKNPPPKAEGAGGIYGNQLVVIGGVGGTGMMGNDIWSWDTDLLTWSDSSIFRIPIHRSEAGLVKESSESFIIFGGSTAYIGETLLNDLWRYNISSSTWSIIERESNGVKPYGRAGAMMAVYKSKIFVFGGRTSVRVDDRALWSYDLNSKGWSQTDLTASLRSNERPFNRVGAQSVQIGKHVWIWGGQLAMGLENVERYASIFLIDLDENTIERKTSKTIDPRIRQYHSMVQTDGNNISILGGESFNGNIMSDVWDLDTNNDRKFKSIIDKILWNKLEVPLDGINHARSMSVSTHGNVITYGPASGSSNPAWMIQRDYGTATPMHIDSDLPGYKTMSEHSGTLLNDMLFIFGGKRGSTLTSQIVAYKPGFCNPRRPKLYESTVNPSFFDDGSGRGMFLTNTDCSWVLADATHINVNFTIRSVDSLMIYRGIVENPNNLIFTEVGQEVGNNLILSSTNGFLIRFRSSGDNITSANENLNIPCYGCEGFKVVHAKCPSHSFLSADSKSCVCDSGFIKIGEICHRDSNSSSSVLMGIIIGVVSGVVFLSAIFARYRYKKRINEMKQKEKQLYAHISFEDVEIRRQIGSGSYGDVYVGKWRGADVAIKFLSQKKLDKHQIDAFKKEISIMVELRHPNIVLYMGACFEEKHLCIICEFMHKGSLYDVLHDDKPISLPQKIQFMSDICRGMQYLHMSNPPIIHRDLKSLNILVDDRNKLKVSDFGLSTINGSGNGDGVIGSLLWLAPEVIQGGEYTLHADVYSVGIIAWEILSRKDPYHDIENTATVIHKVLVEMLRPLMPSNTPGDIESLITSMWAHYPQERPTFQQISKRIDHLIESSKFDSKSMFSAIMSDEDDMPGGNLCSVSTHISGSERLWELCPGSMGESVMLHNKIIREVCKKYKGYVNQNDGENFVIIFQESLQAIRFCCETQIVLFENDWPSDILTCEDASVMQDSDLCGLRIQMGVDFGMCNKIYDEENRKWKFMGKSLVRASRISQASLGGQILMSDTFHSEVGDSLSILEVENQITPIVSNKPEGDANKPPLYQIIPKRIARRQNYFTQKEYQISSLIFKTLGSHSLNSAHSAIPNQIQSWRDENSTGSISSLPAIQKTANRTKSKAKGEGSEELSAKKKEWEIQFEEFSIENTCIGSGSFGSVFVGIYKDRKVAIKKCLVSHNQTNDDALILFFTEVSILSKLRHPNIVEFIGASKEPPNLAIVMEFVEPGSLQSVIQNTSIAMSEAEKSKIICGIIHGMDYLHSKTPMILHRDLKSANILVTSNFDAKICDFGFARMKVNNRTMTKCGTMAYQAPEIIKGHRYNEKADVYSFGIILWEVETRQAPYHGRNPLLLHMEVINGLRPEIHNRMDSYCVSLMKRCWNADESLRPSFHDLIQEYPQKSS